MELVPSIAVRWKFRDRTDLPSALREGISSVGSPGSVTVRQVLTDPSLGMLSEPFPWPLAGHHSQKEEL